MRRFFLFVFVLFCAINMVFCQQFDFNRIDPELRNELENSVKSEQMYRVLVVLEEQYDQNVMENLTRYMDNETAREFVINEMKRFTGASQANVANVMKNQRTNMVRNLHFFWIFNGFACEATAEVIGVLSQRDDIKMIYSDEYRRMIPEEWNPKPVLAPTRGNAWNVEKVNAPNVWNFYGTTGYTGDGVIVAIIDSGVNYDHIEITNNMWDGGSLYPHHGYDFVNNDNDPMDDNGHGTHVAGTVAGYGTHGTQTGVAPGSKIMALKAYDNQGNGNVLSDLQAIEFAWDNGADIINMSLGVSGCGGIEEYRAIMVELKNARIIAVVSAGNDGDESLISVPYNINAPGNCPPPYLHPDQTLVGGTSATICVGATNSDDQKASFSSIGPVTWTVGNYIGDYHDYPYEPESTTQIGLKRPDVVAPGVNIISLTHNSNTGYCNMDGTSMATPCVAGAIALMLEANPNLKPADIDMILETTAVKCEGETHKNNRTGSGRVDALAAIQAVLNGSQYTITATATPIAGGSVSGSGTYYQNSQCTLTATPNPHYAFTNWTKDNVVVSTDPTYTFTVTEDGAYTANFAAVPQYTITATAVPTAGGTVSGSGTYYANSQCTLTATPNAHYDFTNWTKDNIVLSADPTYTFTVTEDGTYMANFAALNAHTITCNTVENGIINASPTEAYVGETIVLTAYPDDGYGFSEWIVNDVNNSPITVTNNRFTMPDKDVVVSAVFTQLQYVTIGNLRYALNEYTMTAEVSGPKYNNPSGDLNIPSSLTNSSNGQIKTYSVTSIRDHAFSNCRNLTSVTIPNSMINIGDNAFSGCYGLLDSLTIPNSVTNIGDYAFSGCYGLSGPLTIPNSVTDIGNEAFLGCSGLTTVTLGNSVTKIGYRAFSDCSGLATVYWNAVNIDEYPSTNNPQSNYYNPFNNCTNLETVVFGNEVLVIPDYALGCCSSLISMAIGNSVTSIGTGAFRGCGGIVGTLVVPNSVLTIGNSAFGGCSSISSIILPQSLKTIPEGAFSGCIGLTSVTIPNSVTSIGDYAFSGCGGLQSVEMGSSVKTMGRYAFRNCYGLNSVTIPNSVTTIGSHIFDGCIGLTSVTLGNSLKSISDNAFLDCYSLTSVTIPNSVDTIGASAFNGCSDLMFMTIPNSVTTIKELAFRNCSSLTTLTIPNSITYIGAHAFEYCSELTAVYWNAINVVNYASFQLNNGSFSNPFDDCIGLESVVFGNEVQTIPEQAFVACSSLANVTIGNLIRIIPENAFRDCSSLTHVVIPNSVTSIGWAAFDGCSSLTSISLPNTVTKIDGYAFSRCGLTSLTIPVSVDTIGKAAFSYCNELSSVYWNAVSVSAYGESNYYLPFTNCTSLTSVVFGDMVRTIPNHAFNRYTITDNSYWGELTNNLTTVIIGNSVETIGREAFSSCEDLSTISIPNSVIAIGQSAFAYCGGLTTVLMGNSVAEIGGWAFQDCNGLEAVYYAGDIAQWCDITFDGSYSNPLIYAHKIYVDNTLVTNLVIPETVSVIKKEVFSGCNSIITVTIPNSVSSIGLEAFEDCSGLEAVYYTGGIAQWCAIQFNDALSNPLSYAHNLYVDDELVTDLVIPETVTQINNYAFYNCSSLTGTLSIPNSVNTIGRYAFYNCSGLNGTLSISNSVTYIGDNAFEYCNGFTSLMIGNSVASIGMDSFGRCSGLNAIRVHCPTPPSIHRWSFYQVDRSVPVFVPCGTQNDYKAAQYWSEFENINESPYNLVITSNDELGGEISVLEYADCEDNHCAILAVPNIGYNFLGWYVDDYFATITPFCDFTLTEDVTFEARFEMLPNHNVANGTSNLWSDPGTWFLGEVPTSTSSVGIWKDVIVDVDAEVTAVGIYDGSTITVMPGVTLTVTDTLGSTENSSIMIQDGGQLVHSNGEAKATIQKSIEPYTSEDDGWNLISFPLVGNGDLTTIENMLSNQYDLYAYDEPTEVWKNQKYESNDFTSLEAGVGYLYANKGTATDIVPVGEQIGEGTSTIGYTPFYTYYKYSIAENLFLASELLTAGLSTTPIGALYWYATNETGYVQSNISIWMANVDDAELTTTSHNVSEMTLVYTGNMTPVKGWNPFVFNENSFAWDGVSNLLVCVQRNNGAWNSAINWRAHNPGFDAVSYKYTDSNAYDMATETYSMSVTLLRPDTFFQTTDQVGQQSANYLPITMSFAGELENGTAEVTVPLSYTEGIGLAGFNLVGNPFVHNVTSYTGTNVADGCFRLNDTRDNLIVSEISASNPLKPVEGFFVKATATEASITFNHQTRGEKTKRGVINMELSADGKIIDRLLVRNDGDPLEKLSLGHSKARLFVVEDRQEMAAVPMEGNEQPICFKTAKTGTYTITVNLEGMELNYLYLIDHMTGANVNLLVEPSYSFEARNSDYESRFQLLYSPKEASGADDEQFAFISNGSIIIMGEYSNATLQIVDMTGRLAYSLNGRIQCVPTEGMASGAYVLRLINGNKVRTQKIVIK